MWALYLLFHFVVRVCVRALLKEKMGCSRSRQLEILSEDCFQRQQLMTSHSAFLETESGAR